MRYAGERVEELGDRVGTVEARRPAGKEDEGTVWGEAVRGGGGVRSEAGREQLSEAVAGLCPERRGAVAREGRPAAAAAAAAAAVAAADEAGWVALSCTRELRRWWSAPAGAGGGSVRR